MEILLALLVGVLTAGSVWLMLSRSLMRFMLGLVMIGNAANLTIFSSGRLTRGHLPFIPDGAQAPLGLVANPLPQALILTAIVISFGLVAFALVLAYRAWQEVATLDTEAMPEGGPGSGEEGMK
ncbi:Na+/H+ antiporter subunit C [Telmatospirillum sp. J64-1]|uniref:Na+/H+ antiporter subunit C n=1 Tax=Telmatospirillum sp. J64-1 TaxID=2502183 RepID=UPI00115C9F60|nr:Na+/H+ antiporter subunit C [Telmatospirillum sp. J64-1]